MVRTLLLKLFVALLGAAALFAVGLPLGLYWLGLSNIEGRPKPPTETNHIAADTVLLQQTFRSPAPVTVQVLNPWVYTATLLTEGLKNPGPDNGSDAVWLIARDYNYNHLKDRRMSYWHLSCAALSIWLSRNWTTDQIVTAASAIARSWPNQPLPN